MATILVGVAGCSADRDSGNPLDDATEVTARHEAEPSDITGGWTAAAPNGAWFLTLVDRDGTLSGTSNRTQISDAGDDIDHQSGPITGTRTGDNVIVQAHGITWPGRVDGERIVLTVTTGDGNLVDVRFEPGDASDHNAHVDHLAAVVDGNVAANQAEQQRAERDRQERDAAERVQITITATNASTELLRDKVEAFDPHVTIDPAMSELGVRIAELDSVYCADADWEAFEVMDAADIAGFEVSNVVSDVDWLIAYRGAVEHGIAELRPVSAGNPSAAAAISDALAAGIEAQAAIDQASSLIDLSIATINVDTTAALQRAVDRCDITTTWYPIDY